MNIDTETADIYFLTKTDAEFWEELTPEEKQKAIGTAYNLVKTLPFIGQKCDENQDDIFPRFFAGQKIALPKDVIFGIFEEALSLIKKQKNEIPEQPEGVKSLSLGNSSISFEAMRAGEFLSKNSLIFLNGWIKKGFDIEPKKFKEVY